MKNLKAGLLAALAATLVALPAFAYRVDPMQFVLTPSGQGANARLRVDNTHAVPINLELQAFRISVDTAGKRTFTPDNESFVMFPPQATLKPGAGQVFQVRYLGEPNVREGQIYVVRVHQLNSIQNEMVAGQGKANLGLAFNFNTTVIVEPRGLAAPVEVVENVSAGADGKPFAKIVNRGPGVADLAVLRWRIEQAGNSRDLAASELAFGETSVLAPGAERIVGLPSSVGTSAKLSVSKR